MKKSIIIFLFASLVLIGLRSNQDRFFEISKNIETFSSLFKELNRHYVDDVDPSELMKVGVDAMLMSLDPYTTYLSGAQLDSYRIESSGKYGGIGARIGFIDDKVYVAEPMEGYAIHEAGIRAGDVIIEIDGRSTSEYKPEQIKEIFKGQPGKEIKLKIDREISGEVMDFTIERGEVKIKNVPYFGMVSEDIGYIKLEHFTANAGKEVADALKALKDENILEGVILDVRGNRGGLLHEAVNIINVFVDRGVEVVSTKGKVKEEYVYYKTLNAPVDTEIPLVVLTDAISASASEVVSGAIQDLDRGVIIGQQTYGKGLVQVTRPLPYKARLKVTTAKYYTPSGRCIQAIDYVNRSLTERASEMPDSLRRAFETKHGREVLDGAGIDPDIETDIEAIANVSIGLIRNYHVFHYATKYWHDHETLREENQYQMSDDEFNDFLAYMKGKENHYETRSEKKLNEFIDAALNEKYYESIEVSVNALETKIQADKENDLIKHKDEIKEILEQEITSRYAFEKGRIANSLVDDEDALTGIEILHNLEGYSEILAVK